MCACGRVLRLCETPPSPPTLDPVGIKNCKVYFLTLLAFTTHKIATKGLRTSSPLYVLLFFGSSMQAVMKKVVYSF